MWNKFRGKAVAGFLTLVALLIGAAGCRSVPQFRQTRSGKGKENVACAKPGRRLFQPFVLPVNCNQGPHEFAMVDQAFHVIEPPDLLQINAVRLVPLPPYRIQPLDSLLIQFPAEPGVMTRESLDDLYKTGRILSGLYPVEPEGTVNLGPGYGRVPVVDMTTEQIQALLTERIRKVVRPELVDMAKVLVSLGQFRGMQQILGEHLVRPDGTISLGMYGFVKVSGLNQLEARAAVEQHLSQFLLRPEVSLDVSGYNSKVYYVIFDGGGYGEQVARLPIMGKDTVLDALGQLRGLPVVSSRHRIWIARPMPSGCQTILPVDWKGITRKGLTWTNYQIFPGDRLYIQAQPLITLDSVLARAFSPIERMLGITLLGSGTVNSLTNRNSFGVVGGL